MVVLVPSHLPEFASTSMAAVQLRLLPCPALCSRASASAGPSNIALAASHSPTNWPAAVADPSNYSHANSVQARGLSWSAAGPCRCSPRPDTAPAHHTSAQRPANNAPRQKPGGAGQRRRHHPEVEPKAGVHEEIRSCSMHTAAAQGTETTRNRNHTGLSLTDFVSVDTGNANREFTEVDRNELERY